MKKLTVFLTLAVFILGVSALGQKIGPRPPKEPPLPSLIELEDDTTGNYLVIDLKTGDFQFTRCQDFWTMSCTGVVKIQGCNIYLEDFHDNHRNLASINICDQQGKAAIEVYPLIKFTYDDRTFKEYISDKNMSDNTLSCDKK